MPSIQAIRPRPVARRTQADFLFLGFFCDMMRCWRGAHVALSPCFCSALMDLGIFCTPSSAYSLLVIQVRKRDRTSRAYCTAIVPLTKDVGSVYAKLKCERLRGFSFYTEINLVELRTIYLDLIYHTSWILQIQLTSLIDIFWSSPYFSCLLSMLNIVEKIVDVSQ